MKTLIALAALATAATTVTAPALAQPKSGSWQVGNDTMHIYYADLDVNSLSGRAALLARVQRAAVRLCDADRDCVDATVAQISDPTIRLALADKAAVRMASR